MGRISMEDTLTNAIVKMAGGIPGAAVVLGELAVKTAKIDPQAELGALHYILFLDDLEIYDSNIWILFKYACDQKLVNMVALLRGWQLGLVGLTEIRAASSTPPRGRQAAFNFDSLIQQIRLSLPEFAKEEVAA